ncbi:anaerobic ribonucleoside-triphosphate reductase [Candidatus Vampirococcus lugosii]|uniref:Anaerobic ribonucleoside-triphosphate reductase n=1 Tax=Candidatus Vampirococcus lugosii TaxID=2789015 RepID=A0ABS5QMC9_9BACT|nr:anaerobic ribonucleoside-triphosphate reductase [Candidatus Vampirococcus lugosii]MBS8122217.1 Anaerobic ribonucleoside-triphosphate reductase [Candidatus Vampirococcus lugosii]
MEEKRTKCQIVTRVMGYHRPVSQFNIGKKSEFYQRKYFQESSINSKFVKDNS